MEGGVVVERVNTHAVAAGQGGDRGRPREGQLLGLFRQGAHVGHVGGGVLDALLLQQPSRYFYETLTPSLFLRAPWVELDRLMRERPGIEFMVRKGITHALSGLLERLAELQCYTVEEKFNKVRQRSPHIFQLVPHKYIASYLGMDATNFSKLINKQKI